MQAESRTPRARGIQGVSAFSVETAWFVPVAPVHALLHESIHGLNACNTQGGATP